jgi:hypothetical protein
VNGSYRDSKKGTKKYKLLNEYIYKKYTDAGVKKTN